MTIWLERHIAVGKFILVNMNQVKFITCNNADDPSQGTVLHFDVDYEHPSYVVVTETYDEIHSRLSAVLRS